PPPPPPPPRHSLWSLVLLLVGIVLPAAGQSPDPGPPAGLELEPNAIQEPAKPMVIRVRGIPRGETVQLQVLQDFRPDLQGASGSPSPLYKWDSAPAGDEGVTDHLDFQALRAQGRALPEDRRLWLRVSRKGSSQGLYALFGLVKEPCDLWRSVLETFGRGHCGLKLTQVLVQQHRGGAAHRAGARYEVRHLNLAKRPYLPVTVPGTQGATGLAWLDDRTLLVTAAPDGGPSRLLRVPLSGGKAEILWRASCGDARSATAPLTLPGPGGRIAFVRQASASSSSLLSVLDKGKLDPALDLELPGRIHQLVAVNLEGQQILALTLGAEEDHPAFLRIDLAARSVENLGFDLKLYRAVFTSTSPQGDRAIVAFEDNDNQKGWELELANASGKLREKVQSRPEDDLLPAWQPSGGEIAFLAEIEVKEKKAMRAFLWMALFLCSWPAASQETASQQFSLAESHILLGENQKALETYRRARELFLSAGDQLGQGHTWEGEADILFRLGDDHEALDAYRRARERFLAAGDQLGQGDTWRAEAKILYQLGEDQKAGEAYENARQIFRAARQSFLATGEQLRLGHGWYGEAESLYGPRQEHAGSLWIQRGQKALPCGRRQARAGKYLER
ncbi:MAG TPA: tetratricopeptide repeat protein, partial [Thermoanaerobaculia bacterium]|nr:tetratricopeptide repeat protein [Thermoanaerobaculia bacterium]